MGLSGCGRSSLWLGRWGRPNVKKREQSGVAQKSYSSKPHNASPPLSDIYLAKQIRGKGSKGKWRQWR